jgi:hypothetical protein
MAKQREEQIFDLEHYEVSIINNMIEWSLYAWEY